jgi:FlaA1/EpsC-like NDP-sugar epimerase
MLFIFFILNILIGMAVRALVYVILFSLRRSGFNIKHVLLVGYSETAKAYIERILYYREWGYEICGILDDTAKIGEQYKAYRLLAELMNWNIIWKPIISMKSELHFGLMNIVSYVRL